jgi:hypothetical protein
VKYKLIADVIESTGIVEIEADSLADAEEQLINGIDSGEIEVEASQCLNVKIKRVK